MRRPAALFPIALALGAIILAPQGGAQAQDARKGGPIEVEKCQAISKPGSYKLVNNLIFTGPNNGTCLPITADFVTIDLAGFTISRVSGIGTTAIAAGDNIDGIAVQNGSISGFFFGVVLRGSGSIVEGLRVFGGGDFGIAATGIVKGNTVVGTNAGPNAGTGIAATGIITGNYAIGNRAAGIVAGQGSTVIGNTATMNPVDGGPGISVGCPSNVTDNTAVDNIGPFGNLVLNGTGCNNTNNVAP